MSYLRGNIHDLIVDQGSTVHQVFTIKTSARRAIPIVNYEARMQVREYDVASRDPSLSVIASYSTVDDTYLSVDGQTGSVSLLIPPSVTELYSPGSYVYDLEIESPEGETTRIIQGRFIVRAEVTK
jgi:hypothetical protein